MKLLHGFGEIQETTSSQDAQDITTQAAVAGEDEITDEALLEAIVGTGTSGCAGGDTRGPAVPVSIGRRHFHKHS